MVKERRIFMSNIDGVNSNRHMHLKHDGKMGQENEDSKRSAASKSAESVTAQTNKLIIELHLKILITSKDRFGIQAGIQKLSDAEGVDLSQFTYNGKPITELSQDEAKELISEDGYFSVENTAMRIFDFAVSGAGDDPEKLQAARDAILKGFKEAEQLFGGKLPDISYETLDKILEMLDEKIRDLGGSVVDVNA
jgi:hypothetical protein